MSLDLFAPFAKPEEAGYLDITPGAARVATSESYLTLVWRKFRRSITGMIGLVLVSLLLLMGSRLLIFQTFHSKKTLFLFSRFPHGRIR